MRKLIKITVVLVMLSTGSVYGQGPVRFDDENLKECVESELQILDPTAEDMLELTRLRGSHCKIKELDGLDYAENLHTLTLSFNRIESIGTLSSLSNLESLTINDNQIVSLSAVGELDKLYDLDIHNNRIEDIYALSGMTTLRLLVLRGNRITDISHLSDLFSLSSLEIEENEISDISALATLVELTFLNLSYNRISDISPLSSLEYLFILDLSNNDIRSIRPLTSLTGLRKLNLKNNPNLNDEAYDRDLQIILDQNPEIVLEYDPRGLPSVGATASSGTYHDRVRVNWSEVNNGPFYTSFYRVYRAASVFGPKTAVSVWQRDNTFKDTSAVLGKEYHYWISVASSEFGDNARMSDTSTTGWAGRHTLMLSSAVGGEVTCSRSLASLKSGDVVDIAAAPVDTGLFAFARWSGSAVDEGLVLDPTDPFVRLRLNGSQSLKAHFVTRLDRLHVNTDSALSLEPEHGTPQHPFHDIQKAIDVAGSGVTIVVEPGIYTENLQVQGDPIVLTGIDYPVLRGRAGVPLVSFDTGDKVDCVLSGFVLTQGQDALASAIYCDTSHLALSNCLIVGNQAVMAGGRGSVVHCVDSHLTVVNCTIADNLCGGEGAGITLVNSDVTLTNSILWNNGLDDIRVDGTSRPQISYSTLSVIPLLTDPSQVGQGIESVDPRFVRSGQWADPSNAGPVWMPGDYHLRSQSGIWDAETEIWVLDSETSPSIDGGDPTWPVATEPLPNGERVNMGAYGGTLEASRSPAAPDFETGDFSVFDWEFSGDAHWIVTSRTSHSGTYSAQAGSISDDERSALSVTRYCAAGNISFYYKVSSESSFDSLQFEIDGVRQGKWSGESDWVQVSFPVAAGTRTFEWTYSKDDTVSREDDTAWIDDIALPDEPGSVDNE